MVVQEIMGFMTHNILLVNCLFAIVVVFFERRSPKSVWAWLLLLYFLPIVGFVFYLFLGTDMRKRRMFRIKEVEDSLHEAVRQQEHSLKEAVFQDKYTDLMLYNLKTSKAVLTDENTVDIFTDGNELYDKMLEDMREAKHFIHLQYYIIHDDVLFGRIRQVLEEKVREGVEVRILYDAMGCRMVKGRFWRSLEEKGIEVAEFFPALFGRFHLRMNYRNHRKIVVIDNETAYVGGFNIGREYVSLEDRFGHWRDTQLRIQGEAVLSLQLRFLLDWNYAAGKNLFGESRYYTGGDEGQANHCKIQIISSGPDNGTQVIRDNYLRLIHKAKKSIYIQTPYFIPDEAVFESLLIACRSGISVNIMIPCKPDHLFVYWATYSYIGDLVMAGARCYTYDNGFLHAKGMIVDGEVFCYGTANMDIRSFALNFEVNAVVYDERMAGEMERCFMEDLESCSRISKDSYAARPVFIRIKEQICRLLSPLL
ncbi:MAG: cardiolipin synthase [Lachnospiraceae bacterium]|nr:cardiolipin synthase [Lachnospiraceae bacterium]